MLLDRQWRDEASRPRGIREGDWEYGLLEVEVVLAGGQFGLQPGRKAVQFLVLSRFGCGRAGGGLLVGLDEVVEVGSFLDGLLLMTVEEDRSYMEFIDSGRSAAARERANQLSLVKGRMRGDSLSG